MRCGGMSARSGAPTREQHHGLDGSRLAHGVGKGPAVTRCFDIGADHLRRVVVGKVANHVRKRQICLVADAGKACQTQTTALEQQCDFER